MPFLKPFEFYRKLGF